VGMLRHERAKRGHPARPGAGGARPAGRRRNRSRARDLTGARVLLKADWARVIKDRVEVRYPHAERVVLQPIAYRL
jgi:hypothetical protein